jgi:hypothetical protein
MDNRQNTVVATVIAGLFLVVVFLCPWRVETSEQIQWSPIYQPPISYARTYDPEYGRRGGSRIESDEARIAFDILALEVAAIIAAGGFLYVLGSRTDAYDDDGPTDRAGDPSGIGSDPDL